MRLVNAKFVPKLLSQEQKDKRKTVCEDNLFRYMDEGMNQFLAKVVTGDESWVSLFEPESESKRESMQWQVKREQRPKKPFGQDLCERQC